MESLDDIKGFIIYKPDTIKQQVTAEDQQMMSEFDQQMIAKFEGKAVQDFVPAFLLQ